LVLTLFALVLDGIVALRLAPHEFAPEHAKHANLLEPREV
jgi:hypothetical protein